MLKEKFWPGLIILGLLSAVSIVSGEQAGEKSRTGDEAIKSGVEWLKTKQIKDGADKGSWGMIRAQLYSGLGAGVEPYEFKIGLCGFVLYALLSCDVPSDDPSIKDGFAFLDKYLKESTKAVTAYERAAVLLALEALTDARGKKKNAKVKKGALLPSEKKLADSFVKWLEDAQSNAGGWRYGPSPTYTAPGGFEEDISATQFVLLGLKATARLGLPVKKSTFLKALKFNLAQQAKDGPTVRQVIDKTTSKGKKEDETAMFREAKARGWAYNTTSPDPAESKATGSMTTAGICSLIICKSELTRQPELTKPLHQDTEKSINDGIAWLDTYYTVTSNPGSNPRLIRQGDYYCYLYGLERVGMLGNMNLIGSHNWYLDGSEVIIKKQHNDGYWLSGKWVAEGADIIDTCFALLFLKKATKPILTR